MRGEGRGEDCVQKAMPSHLRLITPLEGARRHGRRKTIGEDEVGQGATSWKWVDSECTS